MLNLRVAVQEIGNVTIADLLDEQIEKLDTKAIEDISNVLLSLLPKDKPGRLVVNFSRVHYMGSTLLGTLIRLNKRAIENKGHLKLCALNPPVKTLFTLLKLDLILDIYPDEQSALDSFSEPD